MRWGPDGAMQWQRKLVSAAQSITGDGGGGGAGEVAFTRAGLALGVYIGAKVRGGASLLRLGGNAWLGKAGEVAALGSWRVEWRPERASGPRVRARRGQGAGRVALAVPLGSTWPRTRRGRGPLAAYGRAAAEQRGERE